MVLTNDEKTIIAMPYYNLVLESNPITQATEENAGTGVGTAGTIAFASSNYWNRAGVIIDMPNVANNVQRYINAYSSKLSNATNNKVTAEIGRYYGDNNLKEFSAQTNSESKKLLNPSGKGIFWLGTSDGTNVADVVHAVFWTRLYQQWRIQ